METFISNACSLNNLLRKTRRHYYRPNYFETILEYVPSVRDQESVVHHDEQRGP